MSWLEGYVKEFPDSTPEDIIWAWMSKNYQVTIGDEKILFDALSKVRIIEELQDKGEFLNQNYCKTSMFFELFDANNSTYNILTYSDGEQSVYYKRYYCEDLSAEAEAFLEDNLVEWQTMNGDELLIYCRLGGTEVTGFPNQEHPNVYREGMALKFFGDLVCDYLGEERIARTY